MFTSAFLKCAILGIEIPSNFSGPFFVGVAFRQGGSGSFLRAVEHVLWRTILIDPALRKGPRLGVGVVDGRDFDMEIDCQWEDGILPFVDFAQLRTLSWKRRRTRIGEGKAASRKSTMIIE